MQSPVRPRSPNAESRQQAKRLNPRVSADQRILARAHGNFGEKLTEEGRGQAAGPEKAAIRHPDKTSVAARRGGASRHPPRDNRSPRSNSNRPLGERQPAAQSSLVQR